MSEWKKAFTVEKHRAEEYIRLYESMGYDVRVEETASCGLGDSGDCNICYLSGDYVTIFIRKRNGDEELEDLFEE